MAQRRHHYEQAFESYLRSRRIPYVAVNEARKALLPDPGHAQAADPALKSFDFVLYGGASNLLIEIKGRRLAGPVGARRPRLECWATQDDVDSLQAWERLFGPGFSAAFVFIYWCEQLPAGALFEEMIEHHGRWYALRAVQVSTYALHMRPRSPRWRTVHLPAPAYERVCIPVAAALGLTSRAAVPIGGPDQGSDRGVDAQGETGNRSGTDPLQSGPGPVASISGCGSWELPERPPGLTNQ